MRLLGIVVATAAVAWLLQMFLPWWSVAVASFMVSVLLARRGGQAALGSFLGAFILWVALAAIIDIRSDSILSARVAQIFFVQRPLLLILLTGVIGGLVSSLAGLTGFYLRSMFSNRA